MRRERRSPADAAASSVGVVPGVANALLGALAGTARPCGGRAAMGAGTATGREAACGSACGATAGGTLQRGRNWLGCAAAGTAGRPGTSSGEGWKRGDTERLEGLVVERERLEPGGAPGTA